MRRVLALRSVRWLSIALSVAVGAALSSSALATHGITELCFNPVTCVPPHDNVGVPEPLGTDTNLPSDTPNLPAGGLACPIDDLVSNSRSDYAIGGSIVQVRNETPEQAIAHYFRSATVPAGLLAAEWNVSDVSGLSATATVLERLSAYDRPRILGRMGIEYFENSWHVVWMRACGEYLYPGSTLLAGVVGGSSKSAKSRRSQVKRARLQVKRARLKA